MKQRIGYIDTIRGFTMFLVVFNHVLIYSFGKGPSIWSINDVFVTFRMPLFFFLSGFLMYKVNRFKNRISLGEFLIKKAKVQLIPTLVFSILFALFMTVPYRSLLLDRFKNGYWFTYTLFFYFVIYAIGDFVISKRLHGGKKAILGLLIVFLIYAISKYSVIPSCPWFESPFSNVLGIPNFQFFIFFFFGALARAYFGTCEKALSHEWFVTTVIICFVLLQFTLVLPFSKNWFFTNGMHAVYTLLQSLTGFVGIAAVFIFFRKNEYTITNSRIGSFLQYIGARTLDIYLIHNILVFSNMHYIGRFMAQYPSIVMELVIGIAVTCVIIGLCLLISSFIRCSDTLAQLLFGKVIKDSKPATVEK